MSCSCCLILLVLQTVWAIFITFYMRNLINNDLAYTKLTLDDLPREYRPFTRYDRKLWKLKEIYFGAIFLLPIRFITSLLAISSLALVATLLGFTSPAKVNFEFPRWKRGIYKICVRIAARIILFSAGFLWISHKNLRIKDYDPTYPEEMY